MKALKAIRVPTLTCLFVFLLCFNSYAGDAQDLINTSHKGDIATVQALLAKGANVNAKDKNGGTALMSATSQGHLEVVQALLAKGADVNAKDNDGWTALMFVKHLNVVQALLAKGADVNAKVNDGSTALNIARQKKYSEVVQLLIEAGAKE